ncbi:hypothetical protein GGR51DRAFT_397703 [Nemania sp. FL0031]|nr:hypothetical protein GGR51DRAFT_397703 [Nemania sp. FL0031]
MMFGTLRHSVSSDEPYLLEATDAPFEKRRGQGLKACASCRARKSKCTGEPNGCQRCLSKNIECQYNGVTNTTMTEETRNKNLSPQANAPCDSIGEGDNESTTPMNRVTSTGTWSTIDWGDPSWPSTTDGMGNNEPPLSTDINFSFNFAAGASSQPFQVSQDEPKDCHHHQPSLESTHGSSGRQPPTTSLIVGSVGVAQSNSRSSGHPQSQEPNGNQCSCFSFALRSHESIEVDIVRGLQNNSLTLEDLLQRLKIDLTDCEALLQCHSCRAKSEYIMLILAICEKIAYSLEDAQGSLLSKSREHPEETARKRARNSQPNLRSVSSSKITVLAPGRLAPTEYNRKGDGDGGKPAETADENSAGSNDSVHHIRRKFKVGLWQLDEDDETHVLRGLLMARVERFAALLQKIQDVMNHYQWPVHKGIATTLSIRVCEAFGTF